MSKRGYCRTCGTETEFRHRHDLFNGDKNTHVVGSERFECLTCGIAYTAADGAPPPLKFLYDREPGAT